MLMARVVHAEPSARAMTALLICLSLSAGIGARRWLLYLTRFDQLSDGRLATTPWYFLLLEAALLVAPFALIVVVAYQRRIRQASLRVTVAATVIAAVPFVVDVFTAVF